jgi:hypothetical protein
MEPFDASRPSPASITALISERFPGVIVGNAKAAWFFSLDETHWPNFATIVTTDEHDLAPVSGLARPGAFRLNIGVGKETFARVAGWQADPDYAAEDTLMPHPVYSAQRWISIVNPSAEMLDAHVMPLLDEAHNLLVARRATRGESEPGEADA